MTELKTEEQAKLSVLVVGAGPAGLINARTLIQDGFNVTIVCREDDVGGLWNQFYPGLETNNAWGSFTFSGLDMAMPSGVSSSSVPARTYKRYLQDFYEYFINGKAELKTSTEVVDLSPRAGRGWDATLRHGDSEEVRSFDRVVLAVGYLGTPRIPELLKSSPIPVHHTSTLSQPSTLDELLSTVPASAGDPSPEGGNNTVLVIGGGKSGMDIAALLANRGRKLVWTFQGPMKWFSPSMPRGAMGAGRLDLMMGPKRTNDSWLSWWYHSTFLGARTIRSFWAMIRDAWGALYDDKMPLPPTDVYLSLPHFAGGIPLSDSDFRPLLTAGRIASIPLATVKSITSSSVELQTTDGMKKVRCGAVVAATGYAGHLWDFIDPKTQVQVGLNMVPPKSGYEARVKAMRAKWPTVKGDEVLGADQALVYRGVLPAGRYAQRDLAIAGGTRPLSFPHTTYEVEAHWISSLLNDDPFFKLPPSQEALIEECHAANEYNLARYPGIDPYTPKLMSLPALIGGGTYFAGFNDQYLCRSMLRDMGLDPWRQKSSLGWWDIMHLWDWIDVRNDPEQYATIGEERRALRAKSKAKV